MSAYTNGSSTGTKKPNGHSHHCTDRLEAVASFWSQKPDTIEGMMCDANAVDICEQDTQEILSYLPSLRDKRILEIGAGIGRLSTHLANGSRSLHTVELIPNFVDKNQMTNGHHKHVTFECNDAAHVQWPDGDNTLDLVFTHWLMMYLSDEEVRELAGKALRWLKPSGYFFLRESCFQPCGNLIPSDNPNTYRDPAKFCHLLRAIIDGDSLDEGWEFELQFATSDKTYIQHKRTPNQICFLLKKVSRNVRFVDSVRDLQERLDLELCSDQQIRKWEWLQEEGYINIGGKAVVVPLVRGLNLIPQDTILNVGCGTGGAAFHMASNCGANVVAMDLCSKAVTVAIQRLTTTAQKIDTNSVSELMMDKVQFEIGDPISRLYAPNSFDAVLCLESLAHRSDKVTALKNFLSALKHGGKLGITELCLGRTEVGDSLYFRRYLQQHHFKLVKVSTYEKIASQVGFTAVQVQDRTAELLEVLGEKLRKLEQNENGFLAEFSLKEYGQFLEELDTLIRFLRKGHLAWINILAVKP